MAESEGFEPPIALRLCLISSQVHSTGLCQLSALFTTVYRTVSLCRFCTVSKNLSLRVAAIDNCSNLRASRGRSGLSLMGRYGQSIFASFSGSRLPRLRL